MSNPVVVLFSRLVVFVLVVGVLGMVAFQNIDTLRYAGALASPAINKQLTEAYGEAFAQQQIVEVRASGSFDDPRKRYVDVTFMSDGEPVTHRVPMKDPLGPDIARSLGIDSWRPIRRIDFLIGADETGIDYRGVPGESDVASPLVLHKVHHVIATKAVEAALVEVQGWRQSPYGRPPEPQSQPQP